MNAADVLDPGYAPAARSSGPVRGPRHLGPPPGRLRSALRDRTRREILAAAEDVIAADGLAARMEAIALRAGVSVGTLYKQFEDRQALIAALVRARIDECLACVDDALAAAAERSLDAQLRAYLAGVERHALAHGPLLRVLIHAAEGAGEARPPHSLLEELERRAEAIVDRGVAAGELKPDPARVFAIALVSMARALVVRIANGAAVPRQTAEALADVFSAGTAR